MTRLHVLWDLCVQIGRFTVYAGVGRIRTKPAGLLPPFTVTMYVGLGETRMKTAVNDIDHEETNFLSSLGGLDSQIPRPRGGE